MNQTQDELQLLSATFNFERQQTIWEMVDYRGIEWRVTADGIVRFKKIRSEMVYSEEEDVAAKRVLFVHRDDIIADAPVFKRVA